MNRPPDTVKTHQTISRVVMLDDGIETDSGVAGTHERQRGIALQSRERPGGDDAPRLHQYQMIRQPLDFGHIVADIDHRQ